MWDAAEAWLEDKVDVLMNNAGVFSREDWRPMADINMTGLLAGTMLAMQAADIKRRSNCGVQKSAEDFFLFKDQLN